MGGAKNLFAFMKTTATAWPGSGRAALWAQPPTCMMPFPLMLVAAPAPLWAVPLVGTASAASDISAGLLLGQDSSELHTQALLSVRPLQLCFGKTLAPGITGFWPRSSATVCPTPCKTMASGAIWASPAGPRGGTALDVGTGDSLGETSRKT